MKIKINFGFGNGQKGGTIIDTDELPKRYDLLHGQAAMSAEIIKDAEPATGAPSNPDGDNSDALRRFVLREPSIPMEF